MWIQDAARVATQLNRNLLEQISVAARAAEMTKSLDFAEAVKAYNLARPTIGPQMTRKLATINEELLASFQPRQQHAFAQAVEALDMSAALRKQVTTALRDWPRFAPTQVAHSPAPIEPDDAALAVAPDPLDDLAAWWDTLSPAKRRAVARDLLLVVAAFLGLAGYLADSGATMLAGAAFGFAGTVFAFYCTIVSPLE